MVARTGRRSLLAVLLATLMLLAMAAPAQASTLRYGSSGPEVSCWQKKLRWVSLARPSARVPLISVDGQFGTQTTNATKAFQRATHLVDDGIVGEKTQTQMSAELGTAHRDRQDEYAARLFYGQCGTTEPMVCQRVAGYPYIRDNPNYNDYWHVQFYSSIRCTKVDGGLQEQRAALYLRDQASPDRIVTGSFASKSGLRTTSIQLGKALTVTRWHDYRATQGVSLIGNVMFMSVPGCNRRAADVIVCEWTGSTYTAY